MVSIKERAFSLESRDRERSLGCKHVRPFSEDKGIYTFFLRFFIHVKLEKFKRGRSPSLHLAKEGDFARKYSVTLILSINIQILAEILEMMRYSLLIMA